MSVLTRSEIVAGLRALGVQAGDKVLMHSSLSALGQVEGGAETVIDAFLEAVGPEGLAVVPTFACPTPFDRRTSPTALGSVPDHFWRRPQAVRSKHPTHSVAAIGAGAEALIRDHEKAPTAYAEGTPYYKLAMEGGKILLLGVDQDRNTTLHAAEALAGVPYLKDITATYIEDNGQPVTIPITAMAGPHRNFLALDPLFRARGVMRVGRIGRATCRLLDTSAMLSVAVDALEKNPAAVLCDNPACAECVRQRGLIHAARLAAEDFTLAAVAGEIAGDLETILPVIQGEGIAALEVTPEEYRRYGADLADAGVRVAAIRAALPAGDAATLARSLGVPLIVPVACEADREAATALQAEAGTLFMENAAGHAAYYAEWYRRQTDAPRLAFHPGNFAVAGDRPFRQVFYRGSLRQQLAHFYLADARHDGTPALPGQGNGEVKEILSMLRCRGYDGVITLRAPAQGVEAFKQTAAAFRHLLETM